MCEIKVNDNNETMNFVKTDCGQQTSQSIRQLLTIK